MLLEEMKDKLKIVDDSLHQLTLNYQVGLGQKAELDFWIKKLETPEPPKADEPVDPNEQVI